LGTQLEAEERTGRISVRTSARPQAADYRRPALAPALEIERGPLPFALSRAQITVIFIAAGFSVALFAVLLRVGATPLPCLGPVVLLACWALLAHQRGRRIVLAVGADAITVARPWSRERIALDRIEGLGVGLDAPYSTVWITVRDRGRVLLLDGLTRDEAELVSRRLHAVIAPSS
jgi:hypothetical protein